MATDVSICSSALMMLGAKPIASFDEAGEPANLITAKLCGALYPQVKLAMLRRHPWNCAIKRVQLSPDITPPPFGYQYRYQQPGDWLRTLQVGDRENDPAIEYRHEGGYFLCDEGVFPLVYIANVAVGSMDSLLIDALTYAMKFTLAYPITKTSTVEDAALKQLQGIMREARAVDGQDDPPDTFGDLRMFASRLGGDRW